MTILYSKLARVYHEMYQTIFNYDEEFQIYDTYLQKYEAKTVLELGCGSGNLGIRLLNANYEYVGIDLFSEMLVIAKEEFPMINVQQGDMRSFELAREFDAIIITGRSFCYLTTNKDVLHCLVQVYKHLKPGGLLIFDNFFAPGIFLDFQKHMEVETSYQARKYKRISTTTPNFQDGWTWNWNATYIVEEEEIIQEYQDDTILRAFTGDELQLFLKLCGLQQVENKMDSFAIWTLAQKKGSVEEVVNDILAREG